MKVIDLCLKFIRRRIACKFDHINNFCNHFIVRERVGPQQCVELSVIWEVAFVLG